MEYELVESSFCHLGTNSIEFQEKVEILKCITIWCTGLLCKQDIYDEIQNFLLKKSKKSIR